MVVVCEIVRRHRVTEIMCPTEIVYLHLLLSLGMSASQGDKRLNVISLPQGEMLGQCNGCKLE